MKSTTIIAISGASTSGKSLFAETVYNELLPDIGAEGITILKKTLTMKHKTICLWKREKKQTMTILKHLNMNY